VTQQKQAIQQVTMSAPDIGGAEIEAVNQVLRTPYLSLGPRLNAFEAACAAYLGARQAVGVNSGTSGLHLCVIAAGVEEGDLVITSPFSFISSANCVLYERALPVFVDVDPLTGNLDPARVAEAVGELTAARDEGRSLGTLPHGVLQGEGRTIPRDPAPRGPARTRDDDSLKGTGGPESNGRCGAESLRHAQRSSVLGRLKAILPVHAFGQPADMDPILETAREHGLAVIEDACEAMGAEYKGRRVGGLGHAAVFAFYPNKQITTGEGGMIVTGEEGWGELFRSLRNQGRDVFDGWLNHARLGYNYRLDEMSAALGLAQIERIEELLGKRARVAGWYDEGLADVELIERPHVAPTTSRMSWFVYVVRVRPPAERNRVMEKLAERGIPSRPYFTPIHLQPLYRRLFGYRRGDFPVTEYLGDVSLALPFSGVMTQAQVAQVCEALRDVLREI
jgi:perosamine synthetase